MIETVASGDQELFKFVIDYHRDRHLYWETSGRRVVLLRVGMTICKTVVEELSLQIWTSILYRPIHSYTEKPLALHGFYHVFSTCPSQTDVFSWFFPMFVTMFSPFNLVLLNLTPYEAPRQGAGAADGVQGGRAAGTETLWVGCAARAVPRFHMLNHWEI